MDVAGLVDNPLAAPGRGSFVVGLVANPPTKRPSSSSRAWSPTPAQLQSARVFEGQVNGF